MLTVTQRPGGQLVPRVAVDALAGRLAHPQRRGQVPPGQHQRELLAPVAGAERGLGQAAVQLGDDALQHPIAEQVPVGVVDLLEVVGVDQRDGDAVGAPGGRVVEQRGQPLVEVAPVVAGGEAVPAALLAGLGVLPAQPVELGGGCWPCSSRTAARRCW